MKAPLLRIYGVTMNFSGLRALNEVSLDMEEGAITGIIGPNGAGKSTLFNVIAGNFTPSLGKVVFADRDITGFSPDIICQLGISRTYQSVRPFLGLSVSNNVKVSMLYGRGEDKIPASKVEGEIRGILESVHLNKLTDKRAEELIPLDRKRLEIARALATNPRLILLDEIVAGLTPTETLEMMDTIRNINRQGTTVLLVEHVMKAVMGLSHHIVVLHHGYKIAEGNPDSVSKDQNVIQAYLGAKES